jgi:hypothetical protein
MIGEDHKRDPGHTGLTRNFQARLTSSNVHGKRPKDSNWKWRAHRARIARQRRGRRKLR